MFSLVSFRKKDKKNGIKIENPRNTYSYEQLRLLKEHFKIKQFIHGRELLAFAKYLELNKYQVAKWFQNARYYFTYQRYF